MNKDKVLDALIAVGLGNIPGRQAEDLAHKLLGGNYSPNSYRFTAPSTPKTPAELYALAIEAEAAEQAAAEAKARADQLAYQLGLANATWALLTCIQSMDGGESEVSAQFKLANFRKELSPLAAAYGYKIVLVGDKTRATLSK